MPRLIKTIDVRDVQYVAHRLAKETMNWNEPIPDFETQYPNKLESCLFVPFQTFGNKLLYKGLVEKAAILFYLLVKNHPFQNGNKRLAVTTMLIFLHRNKKWLRVDTMGFYSFAIWVAESRPEFKEEVVAAIRKFLIRNLVNIDA